MYFICLGRRWFFGLEFETSMVSKFWGFLVTSPFCSVGFLCEILSKKIFALVLNLQREPLIFVNT